MSRKSSQSTNGNSAETAATVKRTRTFQHTLRIVKADYIDGSTMFAASLDGKVTADLQFFPDENRIAHMPDMFGAYDGLAKYIKSTPERFVNVLITKSPDLDVVSAQADKYVVENFVRAYLDRIAVKMHAELEGESAAEREALGEQ